MSECNEKQHSVSPFGDFVLNIGSDAICCGIQVPQLPGLAASLRRRGDRIFLKNQDPNSWIHVNNEKIVSKKWIEITRYDEISVCDLRVSLDSRVFLGQSRLDIDTSKLYVALPGKRILCNGTFLRAKRGTLTAIMGPSGSGKTVLLQLLNGDHNPTKGHITLSKHYDMQRNFPILKEFIGYVPQDELMIPDLTVRQSLDYRLRVRHPDMALSVRYRLIEETCKKLGFHGNNLKQFLNTVIGSPESGHRGLSGGEKKRANIAHELVLKPLILILDEPTSGLSSVGADQIVELLHQLAQEDGLTVIAAIHQPSRDAFNHFDDLLIYTPGGSPAFYGKAADATRYFEQIGCPSVAERNPSEYIELVLTGKEQQVQAIDKYRSYTEDADINEEQSPATLLYQPYEANKNPGEPGKTARRISDPSLSIVKFARQWLVLFQRNVHVLFKDKLGLWILFGQVPLIALLVVCTFFGFVNDNRNIDKVSNEMYHFETITDKLIKEHRPVNIEKAIHRAVDNSKKTPDFLSEIGAKQRGAIYFVLVASSIWFGIMGGCKEIVFEKHILKRELRSGVYPTPYLLAKLALLTCTGGLQTAGLSLLTLPFLLLLSWKTYLYIWMILWLVSVAAASLGLFVSCISKNYRFALTTVPLLVIPQLLLGGLLRPFVEWGNEWWLKYASALTIQRWGFAAALGSDPYAHGNVLKLNFVPHILKYFSRYRYGELNFFHSTPITINDVFFPVNNNGNEVIYLMALISYILIFYLLGAWKLSKLK